MEQRTRRILTVAGALGAAVVAGTGVWLYRAQSPRPPQPRTTGTRVAAVGDSITFGVGVNPLRRTRDSYPAQLERLLGPGYEVLDYGASGRTVQDEGDSPYRSTEVYRASLRVAPSVVVLMLGTNDSKPQNWDATRYEPQLENLVRTYQRLPSRPSVLLLTPPSAYANRYSIRERVLAGQVVDIVRRVGELTGARLVDVHAATAGHPELFGDGVHPNRRGAELIAATVRAALAQP